MRDFVDDDSGATSKVFLKGGSAALTVILFLSSAVAVRIFHHDCLVPIQRSLCVCTLSMLGNPMIDCDIYFAML
jgi:hypothetical protein